MIEMENTQTTSYQIKIYPKKTHTEKEHHYVYIDRWAYVELKRLPVKRYGSRMDHLIELNRIRNQKTILLFIT